MLLQDYTVLWWRPKEFENQQINVRVPKGVCKINLLHKTVKILMICLRSMGINQDAFAHAQSGRTWMQTYTAVLGCDHADPSFPDTHSSEVIILTCPAKVHLSLPHLEIVFPALVMKPPVAVAKSSKGEVKVSVCGRASAPHDTTSTSTTTARLLTTNDCILKQCSKNSG